jgi:hypothetical protein
MGRALSTRDAAGPVWSALRRKRESLDAAAGLLFWPRLNDSKLLSAFFCQLDAIASKPAAARPRTPRRFGGATIRSGGSADRIGI